MKIAFISAMSCNPWGGSEELWAGTAKHLAADGHEVFAQVQGWPQRHPRVESLARAGIHVHERPFLPQGHQRWRRLLHRAQLSLQRSFGADSLDRWLSAVNADWVCVSNGGYSDGLPYMTRLAAQDQPFGSIVQANGPQWWPAGSQFESVRKGYQQARAVWCVSHANLRLLRNMLALPLPQARVVWNPYQVQRDNPPPWPTSTEPWRLACVARLEPNAKGQDLILEVLARPEWRERPVTLSLFGTGDNAAGLKALSTCLGLDDRVRFHGQVADVAGIWREHHCLVLSSRLEGLPLALVEALLCGRPAVVTDIAGNPEVVQDGITGFIAAAPNTERLAEAMERAWHARENWQAMGAAARQHMLQIVPEDPCRDFANLLLEQATG